MPSLTSATREWVSGKGNGRGRTCGEEEPVCRASVQHSLRSSQPATGAGQSWMKLGWKTLLNALEKQLAETSPSLPSSPKQ